MEDFDIYADLPSFHADENENENQENNSKKLQEKNEILEKEVSLLKTKFEELESLNNKLKRNFSSLIKTAKAEISRKDRMISELRTQLDNITFRRNQYPYKKTQIKNNHYVNYPPPPIETKFTKEVKQCQESKNYNYSKTNPLIEESLHKENIEAEIQHSSNIECNDATTNNLNYRNTVYGDRLRKRLMQQKEDEKKKKEEELKQKNECFDKVNNKENLALINEPAENVDNNINTDIILDTINSSTDFVKTEIILTKKNESLEPKEDQVMSKKCDIPKTNKSFDTNSSVIESIGTKYTNNCNDLLIPKDHRNRDYCNQQDRYRFSDAFYTKSNNRQNEWDKYNNSIEKYDRHRNSHKHKSQDRERSSSRSESKDNHRKRHYKPLDDKYDHPSKKIKLYKNDKEDKHNYESNQYRRESEDRKKLQSFEKSYKRKEHRSKTPKRKRRLKSQEIILDKIKQRNTSNEYFNENTNCNKSSLELKKNDNIQNTLKESIQQKERKRLIFDSEKSGNSLEKVKVNTKLNKNETIIEEISTKQKESVQEEDKKKITIQEYNEKVLHNIECTKNATKTNKNAVKEIKTNDFKQKDLKIEENQNFEKVINNVSYIIDTTRLNQNFSNNVECSLEELEEGEILDSPNPKLKSDWKEESTIKNKINIETKEIKEISNNCKKESNDLFEINNENFKTLEMENSIEEHSVKSTKPKKNENKNTEGKLLKSLLTQDVSKKFKDSNDFIHKENQKNFEKSKLNLKSVKCENSSEECNKVLTTNTKLIKRYDDKVNNSKSDKQEDNNFDYKLQVTDNDEISNEKIVENISNLEEQKNNKKLQIKKNEVKNICIEIDQNITDKTLQKQKTNINNINNEVLKPLNHAELPSINKETENSLSKKIQIISKPQISKNIIVIRRRRKPVQLSDSPPVLMISKTDLNKSM